MQIKRYLGLAAQVLGLAAGVTRAGAAEVAPYEVLINHLINRKDCELREYKPHLLAETIVEGSFSEVGNEGFRRLFRFISGENRRRRLIAMTAPVDQAPVDQAPVDQKEYSERIEMTAPVNQEMKGGVWVISFLMPSPYTMDTIPQPVDERIHLREAPGGLVAALRYSGSWSGKRFEERKARLQQFISEQNLKASGEAVFARYNPPFTPWFLRRNEVLIPVRR
jgi:hypothetical protein